MVIHAWVQGWVAVCIAPARKASIPCKGSGRPRPGKLGCACVWRLRCPRKRRATQLLTTLMNLSGTLNRDRGGTCPSPELSSGGCAMRCRGVARAFARGLLVFSGKQTAPYLECLSSGATCPHAKCVYQGQTVRGGVGASRWVSMLVPTHPAASRRA